MKKTLLLFISISIATILQAQPTWQQCMNSIYMFSLATTTNGYIFGAGGNGMKMSTTGAPSSFGTISNYPCTGFQVDLVANGNLIFLGSHFYSPSYEGRGVWMSADFGATWTQKNNGLGNDTNVVRLAVLANGVMLANTTDGYVYKTYRSSDYGNTWSAIQNIYFMESVNVVSPTEAYMCAGTYFYKSIDNGLTWSALSTVTLSRLVILSNGIFYATSGHAILQSIDNGINWDTLVSTGLPSALQCGGFLKTPGDTVFYANTTAPWGLFYSNDFCATWNTCETGFTSTPQIFPQGLILGSDGYLYAGPSYGGIARTTVPISYITTETIEIPFRETITVYPNPSTGKIFISTKEVGYSLFSFYTIDGKEIYSQVISAEKSEIDLSEFPSGIYLLKIKSGDKTEVKRIVRE